VKFCDITYDIMCLTIFSNHKICVVYVVIHLIYIYRVIQNNPGVFVKTYSYLNFETIFPLAKLYPKLSF